MKYKYFIIDAQYVLTRNFHLQKNNDHFDKQSLGRSVFYSVAKIIRELIDVEKVILLWDKWPYHKRDMLDDYKGDREYFDEEDLVDTLTPEERSHIENELRINKIKQDAKWWVINQFKFIGMPSFFKGGFEADDLAMVLADIIGNENDDKKSVLGTSDGDWKFFMNPKVDYLKFAKGKNPVIISSYDDFLVELNYNKIKLSDYKAIIDSLIGSHNNLTHCLKPNLELTHNEMVDLVITGRQSEIVNDEDLFERQLESFNVYKYPDIDKVKAMFYYKDKAGALMNPDDFHHFAMFEGLNMDRNYYKEFHDWMNPKLYKEEYTIS